MEKQSRRIHRIEEQLRRGLSDIRQPERQDPGTGLASVTHVTATTALRNGRVFVTVLGDEVQRKRTLQGLRSAASDVRHSLSKRPHHLKRVPELAFDYHEDLEKEMRIEELLEQIKHEEE